ncbi:MAG: hypothetical protein B6D59_05675 [Campylobacteraceae bacterium 4484_4]|nr:MAG: hypothetical protein B6D59_05675 [Campylobacteraceae bacterium 4484_4]
MILYDENYRFLGISNETLAFLGYEDLSEFLSMHSDFADLFQKRDGYVYKFENFSWIDFILYSGAGNKNGIIQLKNGEETEIKIHIKEVYLAHPIENANKLYSVKIISEQFKQLASQTDPNIILEEKNSPVLNTFMTDPHTEPQAVPKYPAKQEPVEEIQKSESEIVLAPESESEEQKREEEPLTLNFDALESIQEPSQTNEPSEEESSPFILDFSKETPPILESDEEENEPTEEAETEISFLKIGESTPTEVDDTNEDEVSEERMQESTEPESETAFSLDFLKKADAEKLSEEQEEEKTPSESLFVPSEVSEEIVPELKEATDHEESPDEEHTPLFETEALQSEQKEYIIEQIKHDLAEIDDLQAPDESVEETNEPQRSEKIEEPHEEAPKPKAPSLDAFKAFQIEETEERKRQHSFSQTLKSLFKQPEKTEEETFESEFQLKYKMQERSDTCESETTLQKSEDEGFTPIFKLDLDQESTPTTQGESASDLGEFDNIEEDMEENPSFPLKLDFSQQSSTETEKEQTDSSFEEEKPLFQLPTDEVEREEPQTQEKPPVFETEKTGAEASLLSSLEGLGLPGEEAFALLEDFIYESRSNIDMINNFIMNYDFDNILYSLIKIRGSAEVLNLNNIIQTTNAIKEASQKKEMDEVIKYTGVLESQIDALETEVQETTV